MKFDILHRTRYTYAAPARDSFNDVRLEPPSIPEQKVESFLLRVLPAVRLRHYVDFYGNWIHHFEIPEAHNSLLIESRVRVETHWPKAIADDAELCPLDKLGDSLDAERCFDFLRSSRYVEMEADAWRLALDATDGQTDVWQAVLALMRFTHGYLKYLPNSTHVHTHMRDVIVKRSGVCQDYAHFLIGLCRSVKIPARYVSGYLATEIASATHAWTEVFIPGLGWRALDPTHNCQINETYVKIGHGRDYADVPPVTGNYHGTLERTMEVEVKIKAIDDGTGDETVVQAETKFGQRQSQK
jgi:transglutaminase-like putative cysteine protease